MPPARKVDFFPFCGFRSTSREELTRVEEHAGSKALWGRAWGSVSKVQANLPPQTVPTLLFWGVGRVPPHTHTHTKP